MLQWTMLFTVARGNMANVKIGVPENYNGIFPWYLAKVRLLLITLSVSVYLILLNTSSHDNKYRVFFFNHITRMFLLTQNRG